MDHDYVTKNPSSRIKKDTHQFRIPYVVSQEVLMDVKKKVELFLPPRWFPIVDQDKIHVVFVSIQSSVSVQRSLVILPTGQVELYVHSQKVDVNPYTSKLDPPVTLDANSANSFVDRIINIVNNVRKMEVCSGYDEDKYQAGWSACTLGEIDRNPFKECRYVETFRSATCLKLVNGRTWRCSECKKLFGPLKRRAKAAAAEQQPVNTANKYLTEEQKLKKLQEQRTELDKANKKMKRLQERMQQIIKEESIKIEQSLSDSLTEILKNSDISPAQSIFLQQQVKASQQKNASSMRWHPTILRFALSLHLTSPTAYELVKQTGMLFLPSSRTLFDYSHVKPASEGVDKMVLNSVAQRVHKFMEEDKENQAKEKEKKEKQKKNNKTGNENNEHEEPKLTDHKKFHVLMADEMYISQNLVFQKSTGKLLGYTSLDEIDQELRILEQSLDNPNVDIEDTSASKVLVYMIKGVTNGIKEVVASYAVGNLSARQMYDWTWKVIGALERSGIAVVAFVSDGSSVNRAFIRRHKPVTPNEYGIVFDTWNKCARGRKLFFIADVPHLLKTIRNCFLNSQWDGKKTRRKMMKNGKKISWGFIIKLYKKYQGKSLRKSFKLNAMNVYPDSYARMKVNLAGQVVSKTVCIDLRSQGWPDALETALFIEKVNDWFDCLNGAHSSLAKRYRNANIAPYTSTGDSRFLLLEEFLEYLNDWEKDAQNPNMSINASIGADTSKNLDDPVSCDESDIEERDVNAEEEDTPVSRRLLSKETLEGIRMTTLAFKPLITLMLLHGASFINARVFTQDPLEQHFSKIRAGQGGSNNPNLNQVLNKNRALHTIGQLGMRKRKGNSGEGDNTVEVTTEPLPKRKCTRGPKFCD